MRKTLTILNNAPTIAIVFLMLSLVCIAGCGTTNHHNAMKTSTIPSDAHVFDCKAFIPVECQYQDKGALCVGYNCMIDGVYWKTFIIR